MGGATHVVPRPLGKSGLAVSPIGFGAFKLGRNEGIKYPEGYRLPDEQTAAQLLNGALDAGVTLIDTAPAYGLSEARIGSALERRRAKFVLSTKVGETFAEGRSSYDFSPAGMQASVERSLNRLHAARVDALLLHCPREDLAVLRDSEAVETLLELKKRGLTATVGFSGKTPEAASEALSWADVLMIEYHLLDESHAPVIREAAKAGVGVIVKKGLASGRLPAAEAVKFVLSNRGVASVVIGTLSLAHLGEAIAVAEAIA